MDTITIKNINITSDILLDIDYLCKKNLCSKVLNVTSNSITFEKLEIVFLNNRTNPIVLAYFNDDYDAFHKSIQKFLDNLEHAGYQYNSCLNTSDAGFKITNWNIDYYLTFYDERCFKLFSRIKHDPDIQTERAN